MEIINTVIVPHLNYSGVEKSIKSFIKHTPKNYYYILIDQSPEGKPELDKLVDMRIRCKNLGFAKAMNLGMKLAQTKYVTCLNDDVEFLNNRWWSGIEETFRKYGDQALGVNPASVRDPDGAGGHVVMPGFQYLEDWSEEEYNKVIEAGKGYVIDGICTWGTVFNRKNLDNVLGSIPGKCWYDELYWPGGGEDYDLNRRAYLTCCHCYKHRDDHNNSDHQFRSFRMLGTNLSYVWHWWYKTVSPLTGQASVKFDGITFNEKWGNGADIYGKGGNTKVKPNFIRDYP